MGVLTALRRTERQSAVYSCDTQHSYSSTSVVCDYREKRERADHSQLIISDKVGVVVRRLPGQLNGRSSTYRTAGNAISLSWTTLVLSPCMGALTVRWCWVLVEEGTYMCVCVCPANDSQVGNDDVCFVGKHQFVHIGMVSQSFTHEGDIRKGRLALDPHQRQQPAGTMGSLWLALTPSSRYSTLHHEHL